jgi:hypothetical protein
VGAADVAADTAAEAWVAINNRGQLLALGGTRERCGGLNLAGNVARRLPRPNGEAETNDLHNPRTLPRTDDDLAALAKAGHSPYCDRGAASADRLRQRWIRRAELPGACGADKLSINRRPRLERGEVRPGHYAATFGDSHRIRVS